MGISYGDNTYTFAKNIQGDVIGIYRGGGLVAKYEYNAYGKILSITDEDGDNIPANANSIANLNPFRYRGYYYDTETGFYYLQSRYYDPVVGRFLNADAFVSTGQGILGNNMFAYCNNNPILYTDQSGYWPNFSSSTSDNGGGGVCVYVYEYEYTTGFFLWKKKHTGRVYIYKNVSKDYFINLTNTIYGFNSKSDVVVGDYTDSNNPNLYVYRADKVDKNNREGIIDCLLKYDKEHNTKWKRTHSSLMTEWKEHNRYAFASDRARNIDFDNNEEGKGIMYFAWKAIRSYFE